MKTAIISQRKLYNMDPATVTRVRNVIKGDELTTDYSTHFLYPNARMRNNLWIEQHITEFDRLVVLCYRGHTELIKAAESNDLDVVLFKEIRV